MIASEPASILFPDQDDDDMLRICSEIGLEESVISDKREDFGILPQQHSFNQIKDLGILPFPKEEDSRSRSKTNTSLGFYSVNFDTDCEIHNLDYLDLVLPNQLEMPSFNDSLRKTDPGILDGDDLSFNLKELKQEPMMSGDGFCEVGFDGVKTVKFRTKFLKQYWRNDRKNLQCFPFCGEHGDYYNVKMNNLKHTKAGGTCTAAINCFIENSSFIDSLELVVLGRIVKRGSSEFIGQEIYVVNEKEMGLLKEKESFARGSVTVNGSEVNFSFLKSVWKFEGALNKARRATHGPPNVDNYVFEVLVFGKREMEKDFTMVGRGESEGFGVGSTRTLHRMSRKEVQSVGTSSLSNPSSRTPSVTSPPTGAVSPVSASDFGFNSPTPSLLHQRNTQGNRQIISGSRFSPVEDISTRRKYDYDNQNFNFEFQDPFSNPSENFYAPKRFKYSSPLNSSASRAPSTPRKMSNNSQRRVVLATPVATSPSRRSTPTRVNGVASVPKAKIVSSPSSMGSRSGSNSPGIARAVMVSNSNPQTESEEYISAVLKNEALSLGEAWAWTVLLGYFGAHMFYLNKPKMGVLYAFTLGFFIFGYINDILTMPYILARHKISNESEGLKLPPFHKKHLSEAYILNVFLGIFGGHRFYLGHYSRGLLYLLTLGFLGVGVVYDLFVLPSLVKKANEKSVRLYLLKNNQDTLNQVIAISNKHKPFSGFKFT